LGGVEGSGHRVAAFRGRWVPSRVSVAGLADVDAAAAGARSSPWSPPRERAGSPVLRRRVPVVALVVGSAPPAPPTPPLVPVLPWGTRPPSHQAAVKTEAEMRPVRISRGKSTHEQLSGTMIQRADDARSSRGPLREEGGSIHENSARSARLSVDLLEESVRVVRWRAVHHNIAAMRRSSRWRRRVSSQQPPPRVATVSERLSAPTAGGFTEPEADAGAHLSLGSGLEHPDGLRGVVNHVARGRKAAAGA
jgi:hypothetical protein